MTIHRDRSVFARLADLTRLPEASRSAYWNYEAENFTVAADGRVEGETVLGSISAKKGLLVDVAHWVLQAPFRWFPSGLSDRAAIERHARRVADAQARQYTHDMMRQALSVSFARQAAPRGRVDACNLVIGDGFGVLSSVLLLDDPGVKTICVNLTKSLLIDVTRIARVVPQAAIGLAETPDDVRALLDDASVRVIAVRADDASCLTGQPIGAAFNVVSMQEMPISVIAGYFKLLRSSTADRVVFYCCNKLTKTMPDGEEIRFDAYPWRDNDTIVSEGPCPWSQWIYDKTPPFWHHRSGASRMIWHRLAILETDTP
jgi:hypothetical protein